MNKTEINLNRSSFDRKDPSEYIGECLPCFSLYQLYDINGTGDLKGIRQEIYERILQKLNQKMPSFVEFSFVGFKDKKYKKIEGERDYIIVKRETPRKTQANVLIRLLEYKESLYIGIDSYILGQIDFRKFFKHLFLTIFICFVANFGIAFFIENIHGIRYYDRNLVRTCTTILISIFMWRDIIKGWLFHAGFYSRKKLSVFTIIIFYFLYTIGFTYNLQGFYSAFLICMCILYLLYIWRDVTKDYLLHPVRYTKEIFSSIKLYVKSFVPSRQIFTNLFSILKKGFEKRDRIKEFFYELLLLPIRQCFNKIPENESFNTDDIFIFFKAVLPIVIDSIKEIFKDKGVDYKSLDDFSYTIQNINNMKTIINGSKIGVVGDNATIKDGVNFQINR